MAFMSRGDAKMAETTLTPKAVKSRDFSLVVLLGAKGLSPGRGTRIFLPKNRRKFAKFLATNTSLINSVSVLKLICFFISTGILQ